MKNKILSVAFTVLFLLTGCSVDSIFDGGAVQWGISFVILVLVAWALFGGRND